MNKQIAVSILAIAAVSMSTFAMTSAYFSSKSKTSGSKFTVGTLDMEVGGANGSNVEPFVIDNIGDNGVTTGAKTWVVTNKGTLLGRLYFKLDNIKNLENGCNTPESAVDTTCGNPGDGEGELGKMIDVKAYLNNNLIVQTKLDDLNKDTIANTWNNLTPVIIQPGQSASVKLEWSLAPDNYGNEIQSDSLSFDVDFDLTQATN